jgi:hypothetical protein
VRRIIVCFLQICMSLVIAPPAFSVVICEQALFADYAAAVLVTSRQAECAAYASRGGCLGIDQQPGMKARAS